MADVIGIDVGGQRKGFHAVLLSSRGIHSAFQHSDPAQLVAWSLSHQPAAIAIDAPCGWSTSGGSRESERTLAHEGIRIPCFCTPTRARAAQSRFYDWVFNGEKLYQAFQRQSSTPIETYPHGVSEIILKRNPHPVNKKERRQAALAKMSLLDSCLTSVDFIDAALAALTADAYIQHQTHAFGNDQEGKMHLPTEKYFENRS
jgi:predicted nuclease with RNAse H fold